MNSVCLEKNGSEITVNVFGRQYKTGNISCLESVISGGEELLSSPLRIVGTENGKEMAWGTADNFIMDNNEDDITICTTMQSEAFILNTSLRVENDGCMDFNITVVPIGRTPKQTFGFDTENLNDFKFDLTRLWVEIPLNNKIAKFYQFYPLSKIKINGEEIDADEEINHMLQANYIPQHISFPFEEQIFLCNDNVGFGCFFESSRNMQFKDGEFAEIIKRENETVLRLHLLDSLPESWEEKGPFGGIDLHPLSFRIGMIATPVKEFPKEVYNEKALHIDCFKKLTEPYDVFLLSKFEGTDEITFDRIKRLGVNTLYLHERWNDIQNSPFITERTAERVEKIIYEAHKRDIKVIPYFGYEISTLSPYWGKLGETVMLKETEKNYNWSWYRQPYQRALKVCYKSQWKEIFLNGVIKLIDRFNFDGIYIDSMVRPLQCMNEKHGCGWRDSDGKIHYTYPVWEIRDLLKELYKEVKKRGGTINNHSCASYNLATMYFCDSMWEGEAIQNIFMHGLVNTLPEGHFRSIFTGRNLGVPINILCYSNPPTWSFEQALSLSLPFGILPKPNDTGHPLEVMSEIWNITDSFSFDEAKWYPYYEKQEDFEVSDEAFKLSYYENESNYLLFCANSGNKPAKTEIICKKYHSKVRMFAASCKIKEERKAIHLDAKGFAYAIILIEK